MYKWYQDLVQGLDENVDENLKDLDENLAQLTQKTEDPKVIKRTLLPPPLHTHTVNVIELHCKIIKKWQLPHFFINSPPPFQVYPPPPPFDYVYYWALKEIKTYIYIHQFFFLVTTCKQDKQENTS